MPDDVIARELFFDTIDTTQSFLGRGVEPGEGRTPRVSKRCHAEVAGGPRRDAWERAEHSRAYQALGEFMAMTRL